MILDFNCRKATTYFGGRNWEAWFTNDIPITDGPYKFKNLPGLILEVYDIKNNYSFTTVKISNIKDKSRINPPNASLIIDQNSYKKANYNHYLQRAIKAANNANPPEVAKKLIDNYIQKQDRKNNPIELP